MPSTDRPREGDVYTHERTFTVEDVRRFGDLSGDRQAIHTDPDTEGRLVVQGLLTATLPTKIGGDLGVLARRMEFEFHRPVYTGETVRCDVTLSSVAEREDGRLDLTGKVDCRNRDDETVLTGEFSGVVRVE